MDVRGSRQLQLRLAAGAPGTRVEVVSVEGSGGPVAPGQTGTLLSIGDDDVRVLFDTGVELAIDPFVVRLRPLLHRSA